MERLIKYENEEGKKFLSFSEKDLPEKAKIIDEIYLKRKEIKDILNCQNSLTVIKD